MYRLKEKLRIRDAGSALPDLADTTFLDNLNLIRMDKDEVRVTVAGLLFVGKATSLARLLPQAEVIYLHYSDEAQTEYDNRMDMQEPVISILDKLTERIRTYNRLTNVQVWQQGVLSIFGGTPVQADPGFHDRRRRTSSTLPWLPV